ncbi:MAG: DNA gyrase subunit A [Chloroflexi bacterium]|nr:MAG: DNA gyrase subunit A [Chloroflexota bacterium]
MRGSYLDYAMSVIVARALPDARDGLKPVQRRILYAMHDMGLRPGTPYKKSARIVGEVLGKYHPHGDQAVYEAMARMAQDFSLRYPLVDGQGNFGSIDGDNPAAMRYTEARLAPIAEEMLADIEKATVDFVDNFDGTLREPAVLPAVLPNLLVNGASGIAVGMATNIPPHNLGEVAEALVHLIERWEEREEVTVEELMQFIQGPDFPTGGLLYRHHEDAETDSLRQAYAVGRGKVVVRAQAHVEEMSRGRHRIVITELPYQVDKSSLVERIARLVRDGRIEGITDLRDESDRRGMRVVVELTRTVEPQAVLEQLFKLTPLQTTFSINMLALVDGEPRLLSLKRALLVFIEHRQTIIRRRSEYLLAKARDRAHILEGLLKALDALDEVIGIIRRSRTAETAHKNLRRRLKITDRQAQAILEMPLKRLAALERRKLQEEYREKKREIRYLEDLLRHPKKVLALIREEMQTLKARYGDARRTQVVGGPARQVTARDLIPDEEVWLVVTQGGRIARQPSEAPLRLPARPKDPPLLVLRANTRDRLYLFTAQGEAVSLPIHQVPLGAAVGGEGSHWAELSPLGRRDRVVAGLALPSDDDALQGFLFFATVGGNVKRLALADLPGLRTDRFPVMGVASRDALRGVRWVQEEDEVLLVTAAGRAIRFAVAEVRPSGPTAGGVRGVKLSGADDAVVGLEVVRPRAALLVVAEDGYAKRTPLSDYPRQKRHGGGVITARGGRLAGAAVVVGETRLAVVTARGRVKTTRARNAPSMGRPTRGKPLLPLSSGDRVVTLLSLA